MPKPQDYSLERLIDRAQIQDVMYRWCRAVDRLDLDEIRSVFHPDATDSHGIYNGGVEGLIEWIRGRHRTIPFSMHTVANMLIEFGDADTAVVETYNVTFQRYPADGSDSLAQLAGGIQGKPGVVANDLMACARYVDRFERRSGEWRIADRRVVFDSTMMFEVSEGAPKMGDTWTVGKRGNRSDFVFDARKTGGVKP